MISKDPRFTNFYNRNFSKPKNIIKALWIKLVVSKCREDDDPLESCKKLLSQGDLKIHKKVIIIAKCK